MGKIESHGIIEAKNWTRTLFALKLLAPPGYPSQKSRPPKKVCSPCVSRNVPSFLAPIPSHGRTPPHRRISSPTSLSLCAFSCHRRQPVAVLLISNAQTLTIWSLRNDSKNVWPWMHILPHLIDIALPKERQRFWTIFPSPRLHAQLLSKMQFLVLFLPCCLQAFRFNLFSNCNRIAALRSSNR